MKKRILSLVMALVLAIGLLPMSALAADTITRIVTVEKYDATGNGTFLLPPTRVTGSTTSYAYRWIPTAVGSSNITIEDYSYITAYADSSQDDGWLNNGDIASTSKWLASVNGTCYDDVSYFYVSEINVLRIVFSPSGTGSEFNLSNASDYDKGTMAVNKDDLIELLSRYSAEDFAEGTAAANAYQTALDTVLDLDATEEEVTAAKSALESALNSSATGIALSAESLTVSLGKTATVTASLTPDTATDTITWSTGNANIATVDQSGTVTGVAVGTTTLTAKVSDSVSASIPVTVETIEATQIALESTTVTMNVRDIQKLTATVTPPDASGTVSWSVADETIASITDDGTVTALTAGETTVTASIGGALATAKLTVTDGPYVYFEYSDGRENQYMTADGSFTLSSLDQGSFKVGNTSATAWWENEEVIDAGSGSVAYHWYVNRKTGEWQPSGQAPTEPIVVTAGDFTKSFTIKYQASSGITALKTYIGGTEVTNDNPYEVTGCISNVAVTTKGLKDGKWVDVPVQALNYDTSDNVYYNFRFVGNCLEINRAGEATMTVSLKGESVSTTFKVVCNPVLATAMEVIVPETFAISDWDAVPNQYVGLRPFSEGGYDIVFEPANATNRDVTWEALTPDIAEHFDTHSAGIVPKKAGTAKFTVTNVEDPTLTQDVTITFTYKNPLTAAASSASSYTLTKGDIQPLTINVTPENATEQRFTWTYNDDSIVTVTDEIKTSEDGLRAWTVHQIKALNPGTVTVTGTPWDTTGKCKPVTFTVTVTESGNVTPADVSKLVADGISGAQTYLKANEPDSLTYGYEWTIFSLLRSGAAIDQSKLEAYLDSVESIYQNKPASDSNAMKPTTLARVTLTLGVLGEDASDFRGLNLIEMLYNSARITEGSNEAIWALIALDSKDYAVPGSAAWTRDALIQKILSYQDATGGFGLTGTDQVSADVTAMALQALAPYYGTNHQVKSAVDLALTWLKGQLDENCVADDNAESTAQVLTALAALGINPTAGENGFTAGAARNLITGLVSFQLENGGFKHKDGDSTAATLSTIQALYSLEAYDRYAKSENALYDLTDVSRSARSVLERRLNEANSLIEGDYTEASWAAMSAARTAAQKVFDDPEAANEALNRADTALAEAISALVKVSGQPGSDVDSNTINAYVTIVNRGEVVVPQRSVSVEDTNSSGSFDVDDVLYAAHKAAYPGGAAAGYASAVGDYGLSLTKLWGNTSGAFGYWLNNNSCWSLADAVADGDHLVAFVYQDTTNYSDSYSKFDSFTYSAKAGEAVTLTLENAGYDSDWNTVFRSLAGAAITAYDSSFAPLSADSYSVTDNKDGSYSVTFNNAGFYYLTASCSDPLIVPALCTATVSAASGGGSSSPDKDQLSVYISVSDPKGKTYLSKTEYPFETGETAFSLLLKTGLNVESRGNEYGVYVEAIEGLGEFDEGPGSGWMYQVNGQFPEVSASSYTLSSGDYVQWVYTRDLGSDIGASETPEPDPEPETPSSTLTPEADANSKGEATVVLETDAVKDSLAQAEKENASALVIAPQITGEAVKVTAQLPTQAVSAIAKNSDLDLTIETSTASVTLPNAALDSIVSQAAGSSVQIVVETRSLDSLGGQTAGVDLENAVAVEVTVLSGGSAITTFGGKALTIDLPVDRTAYTAGTLYNVLVLSADGSSEVLPGQCVWENGRLVVRVTTTHLSTFIVTTQKVLPFTDVTGHWALDSIQKVYDLGLMTGTKTTQFSPDTALSRAMLVTILYRLEGSPAVSSASVYTDVAAGTWYTDAVAWAARHGITVGYGNGTFGPKDDITREQMAAILYRYAQYKTYDTSASADLSAYHDAGSVSGWALEALQWANGAGLISGRSADLLAPAGSTTRAETAVILVRFLEQIAA